MGFELTELAIVFGCLLPGLHTAYTDIKKGVIYDAVTLLIFLAGLIFAVITHSCINAFIGSALGFFSFFVAAWITNGSVGGGDIKLAAGIGMWFGYVQTIEIIVIACLASILFEFIRYWRAGAFKKLFTDRLGPYAKKVLLRFGYRINNVDLAIDVKYTSIPFAPFLVFSSWFIWLLH
ncbi:MAG TPA: hypothetical protein DD791_10420 [Syntrophomonas sp.]|jgi:leader peptidase (prepilin peptidase)/N-methyltransferase|nr:hypothetical protein [Syntrophomonas sp.]